MPCTHSKLIGFPGVIVCSRGGRKHHCACGATATLQCDWKTGKGKTCDTWICPKCAREVGPEKHLCPEHQVAYIEWKARRAARETKRAT